MEPSENRHRPTLRVIEPQVCGWTEVEDGSLWASACGQEHSFGGDCGPVEFGMTFCYGCGGRIVERPLVDRPVQPVVNVHDRAAALESENATLRRAIQAVPVEADRQRTAAAAARQCSDEGASHRAEMHDFCAVVIEGLAARMGQS